MKESLVSICCITFNHEKFIRACLDGFLMQKTDFTFEILIHDDASTDATQEIIKEYQQQYPDLIKPYFQITNQYSQGQREMNGRYNFPRAQGKYLAICDGDDYWTDPLKLQKQVSFMEQNPDYSLCFHNSRVIYEDENREPHLFNSLNKTEFNIKDVIEENWFIPSQSMLVNKMYLDNPTWLKHVHGGDFALQLILASRGKLHYINEPMAVYRMNSGGVSTKGTVFNVIKVVECLSFFNIYSEFKYDGLVQNKISAFANALVLWDEIPFWRKLLIPEFYYFYAKRFIKDRIISRF